MRVILFTTPILFRILPDFDNDIVPTVSIVTQIFNTSNVFSFLQSYSLLFQAIIITFMIHILFSSLAKSRHFINFSLSFNFTLQSTETTDYCRYYHCCCCEVKRAIRRGRTVRIVMLIY